MVKNILSLTILSALVGCAFGGKNSEQDRQNQEDRVQLLNTYEPIVGLYEKAQRDGSGLNVVLGVFIGENSALKDANGKSKSLPELRVKYRLLEGQLNPDVTLAASLSAAGELIASGGSEQISLRANVVGDKLTGEVTGPNGLLGPFELVRKDKVVRAESSDQELEFYHLVKQRYEKLLGTYKGTLKSNGKFTTDFPVEIELNLSEILVSGKAELHLKASYRRPELVGLSSDRFMAVSVHFNRLTSETELSLISEGSAAGEPADSRYLFISGNLNEDTGEFDTKRFPDSKGQFADYRGQLGDLKLKKVP